MLYFQQLTMLYDYFLKYITKKHHVFETSTNNFFF